MIGYEKKPNSDIKELMQKSGVPQYEIARRCGVGEWTLCRWLRYELTPEKREMILSAIEEGGQTHE